MGKEWVLSLTAETLNDPPCPRLPSSPSVQCQLPGIWILHFSKLANWLMYRWIVHSVKMTPRVSVCLWVMFSWPWCVMIGNGDFLFLFAETLMPCFAPPAPACVFCIFSTYHASVWVMFSFILFCFCLYHWCLRECVSSWSYIVYLDLFCLVPQYSHRHWHFKSCRFNWKEKKKNRSIYEAK